MTDDLVTWLRRQLDEEAAAINLISPGGYEPDIWETCPSRSGRWVHLIAKSRTIGEAIDAAVDEGGGPVAILQNGRLEHEHIARYDPARMLAEVDAKRRILDVYRADVIDVSVVPGRPEWMHGMVPVEAHTVLRLLALPYADRPGYRDEWKP